MIGVNQVSGIKVTGTDSRHRLVRYGVRNSSPVRNIKCDTC